MKYPLRDTGVHCCRLCWKCLFCRTFNKSFNKKVSSEFTVVVYTDYFLSCNYHKKAVSYFHCHFTGRKLFKDIKYLSQSLSQQWI